MRASFDKLVREAERFSDWAATVPLKTRTGEWELDYPNWRELWTAFEEYVSATSASNWDSRVLDILLYVIARDNEMEDAVEFFRGAPDQLLSLARAALYSSERDAKWQIAKELGYLDGYRQEAEELLSAFVGDEDEYVRRRAFMALGQLRSPIVEKHADEFWQTGEEYARMAVLNALQSLDSRLLPDFLNRAETDARPYLLAEANRIREGKEL